MLNDEIMGPQRYPIVMFFLKYKQNQRNYQQVIVRFQPPKYALIL